MNPRIRVFVAVKTDEAIREKKKKDEELDRIKAEIRRLKEE